LSDFARLEGILVKLRQRERIAGEGRRLRGATPEALLAAVVTEIDETILPRRLSFAVEGGATVHLAVANRRLQALVSPVPVLKGADAGGLADQPLADPDDADVGKVRDVLLNVFEEAASVAIRSARPTGGGFPSDVGIPANILARVWGADVAGEEAPSPEAVLSRFLLEMKDDAVAWLRIEGEDVTDQGGDAAAVDALGEQAAMFLDGYFGKFEALYPAVGMASATFVGPMSDTGTAVLFVEIGEVSAFVAARSARGPELIRKWQRLTGA
jgi:hypothetical protein